ncbi:MAG TPA: hypothetical protein VFH89_12655 [Sphingomicrobium sp.]|nr:hypothetical protein [Sphingomicrobium sp.]
MNCSPIKLHQAAKSCRYMAAECVTEEAREALLEVAASLDGEATVKEQSIRRRARPVPMFNWTR